MTEEARTVRSSTANEDPSPKTPRNIWTFAVLAGANLAAAVYLNTRILTEDVYRALLTGQGASGQIDRLLDVTRGWELLGYALSPLTLFVRIGLVALLVQLALVILGLPPPFSRVFRAGTWAQYALLLGTVAQILRLALLAPGARTAEQLQASSGAIIGLFNVGEALGPSSVLLLERVTIFDAGWIILFTLALEESGSIRGADAATAVLSVWVLCTLAQWGFWLYLIGPA